MLSGSQFALDHACDAGGQGLHLIRIGRCLTSRAPRRGPPLAGACSGELDGVPIISGAAATAVETLTPIPPALTS